MGTEYAFVDDKTGEAYDLGRGPWYEWTETYRHTYDEHTGPPISRADVNALLIYYQESWSLGLQPAWSSVVADEIWNFITLHPNARIINDNDDSTWGGPDMELHKTDIPIYKQIGSRYNHDFLLNK